MSFEVLFTGVNFASTIKKYCDTAGWKVAELNDRRAILRFAMNSGRRQTVYIIRFESTLEFSVPSLAAFDSEDRIPGFLSTLLLRRNAENKIGFWCIEKIETKYVYSYMHNAMHNAEMQLMDSNYFARVVKALIRECDDFEESLTKMLDS